MVEEEEKNLFSGIEKRGRKERKKERKKQRKKERKKERTKRRKKERRKKDMRRFPTLKEVGFLSYLGYLCLKAIQWLWSLALTLELVKNSLDQTV